MDGNALDFGELIFSLLIGYVGALEFILILRRLCHFSGRHEEVNEGEMENLGNLQDKLQHQLADAIVQENHAGANVMQDGLAYANGFRIDPNQNDIESLKEKINSKDAKDKRRAELEAELARQKQIEADTRKQLEIAEAKLAQQRAEAAAEEDRKRQEQKRAQQAENQKRTLEEAENYRKLLEAEKAREAEQRRLEDEAEAEKKAAEENARKILDAEKQKEAEQRKLKEEREVKERRRRELREENESEKRLLAAENEFEDSQRRQEELDHGKNRIEKFLENEILQDSNEEQQRKEKQKQKVIEENARKFLEADNEMVKLQQKMLENNQNDEQIPIIEEPITKRTQKRVEASVHHGGDQVLQTVKTQFGQGSNESFTLSSKPILYPSLSDDASSNEPHSSKRSSLNTQPSDELATGTDDAAMTTMGLQAPQHERQDPDGEDNNNTPAIQYTDDYLRSLDGLKSRPLLREDGSGRRRAFKKRRSSGSSTSSRDSRTSRDEELRMFTSLEDEEFRKVQKGDSEYTPITYTNEPNLKVKGHHHRRHKRSPAKDAKTADDGVRSSLEMLGEEGTNPWGELVRENYKDTDFWRREKAMSIDEEDMDMENTAKSEDTHSGSANNKPNSSSFEEATVQQNEEALSTLKKQLPKDPADKEVSSEKTSENASNQTNSKDANLQSSRATENNRSPSVSPSLSPSRSPRLRRSPRVDEMDQYEERWKESENPKSVNQPETPSTPSITVHSADDMGSWRDEHGLIMQGLSDFYDFTASTNPSRSRSTSRNASPSSSTPSTPLPKNVAFAFDSSKCDTGTPDDSTKTSSTFYIHDRTGNFVNVDSKNIAASIQSFHNELTALDPGACNPLNIERNSVPQIMIETNESHDSIEMNHLIESLRISQQRSRSHSASRSRSPSPLPTPDNIQRSLEIRRSKLVRQNDEVFERLSKNSLENGFLMDTNEESSIEYNEMNQLIDSLRIDQRRSRSRSRSPLPTPDNIQRSLETRRSKLEKQNDEIFESLSKNSIDNNTDRSEVEKNIPVISIDSNDDPNDHSNEMNHLIEGIRQNQRRSRSRSRSPLPTPDNIQRSLEIRNLKLERQNDEIFESLSKNSIMMDIDRMKAEKEIPVISLDSYEDPNENSNEMNHLIEGLRQNQRRSCSRSRSPLPTPDNIQRSLETRRSKLERQNDEIFESLSKNSIVIDIDRMKAEKNIPVICIDSNEDAHENSKQMNLLVEDLRQVQRRSRSRSRSPLPTPANLERSLEARKLKLIKKTDELFVDLTKNYAESDNGSSDDEESSSDNDENVSKQNTFQMSLSQDVKRRHSRSRSPLPTRENLERSLETRRNKRIEQNEKLYEKLIDDRDIRPNCNSELIVDQADEESSSDDSDSHEKMSSLVASLRLARSRTRSKSPMRIPTPANLNESINNRREKLIERNDQLQEQLDKRAQTPQNPQLVVEYVYEFEEQSDETGPENIYDIRYSRSRTPSPTRSRSRSRSKSISKSCSDLNFHRMLNLESSQNRTLAKHTEENESILAEKQRDLDQEALQKFKTASEEVELRTLTPLTFDDRNKVHDNRGEEDDEDDDEEEHDSLVELPSNDHLYKVRSIPVTPDYDRTISEEWRDFQRIKKEMLSSGFKRSKYVGESMEYGNEYEPLRREAAAFRRSRSPSPSLEGFSESNQGNATRQTPAHRRQIQDEILKELILQSTSNGTKTDHDNITNNDNDGNDDKDIERYGAKPKDERFGISESNEYSRSESELESIDNSEAFEDMRREMSEFRRSRSCSRSPINENDIESEDLIAIEVEAAKREFQDQMLDKLSAVPLSFQDFSRHLNADFLDDRRSSDSALIHKPDISIKSRDVYNFDMDIEPEEYHHYRRFSMNQEQQIEEYPTDDDYGKNDDDFICVSQVEVHSSEGTRTWLVEDYYNENNDSFENIDQFDVDEEGVGIVADLVHRDDEDTEGSDDERQTVVEVEDEIDTDICDFNERGPTDESHHEQSECEEADRAIDHYANRGARDWESVNDVGEILRDENDIESGADGEEGAVGGVDSISFEIDKIYGEAIKNRKQSGILREYDNILLEMQNNFELNPDNNDDNDLTDKERYALWAKTRNADKGGSRKLSVTFMETEKNDTELRYLGDATSTSRQSTRLRSRYGYGHVPQSSKSIEDIDVDVNYKPKREYNWRKNFKLDDENNNNDNNNNNNNDDDDDRWGDENGGAEYSNCEENRASFEDSGNFENLEDIEDGRKFSLGGESITLYSRSPDRFSPIDMQVDEREDNIERTKREITQKNFIAGEFLIENKETAPQIAMEKPKKKKSKKKSHRESKESLENRYKDDEDDSDSQADYRRNGSCSSRQFETESPKRKSRSRRGSRSSIESSSIGPSENLQDNTVHPSTETSESTIKKKVKKRKKAKDIYNSVNQNIKEEQEQPHEEASEWHNQFRSSQYNEMRTGIDVHENTLLRERETVTAPSSSTKSTPPTTLSTTSTTTTATAIETISTTATTSARPATTDQNGTTNTATTSIDSFDILKDANFYPLF